MESPQHLYTLLTVVWMLVNTIRAQHLAEPGLPEYVVSECYGDLFSFDCGPGHKIRILRDFFGFSRRTPPTCAHHRGDCIVSNPKSNSLIHRYCTGRRVCTYYLVERRGCDGLFSNYQQVEYQCIPDTMVTNMCAPSQYLATSAYIASPNFPDTYPPNLSCACAIKAENSRNSIKMEIIYMAIKFSYPCGDWLRIGRRKTCGTSTDKFRGRHIPVEFQSDGQDGHSGVWMHFQAFRDKAKIFVECGNQTTFGRATSTTMAPTMDEDDDERHTGGGSRSKPEGRIGPEVPATITTSSEVENITTSVSTTPSIATIKFKTGNRPADGESLITATTMTYARVTHPHMVQSSPSTSSPVKDKNVDKGLTEKRQDVKWKDIQHIVSTTEPSISKGKGVPNVKVPSDTNSSNHVDSVDEGVHPSYNDGIKFQRPTTTTQSTSSSTSSPTYPTSSTTPYHTLKLAPEVIERLREIYKARRQQKLNASRTPTTSTTRSTSTSTSASTSKPSQPTDIPNPYGSADMYPVSYQDRNENGLKYKNPDHKTGETMPVNGEKKSRGDNVLEMSMENSDLTNLTKSLNSLTDEDIDMAHKETQIESPMVNKSFSTPQTNASVPSVVVIGEDNNNSFTQKNATLNSSFRNDDQENSNLEKEINQHDDDEGDNNGNIDLAGDNTPTSNNTTVNPEDESHPFSDGRLLTLGIIIVCICVGLGIIFILVALLALCLRRKKRRRHMRHEHTQTPPLCRPPSTTGSTSGGSEGNDSGRELLATMRRHLGETFGYCKGMGHQTKLDRQAVHARVGRIDKGSQADLGSDYVDSVLVSPIRARCPMSDSDNSSLYCTPPSGLRSNTKAVQTVKKSLLPRGTKHHDILKIRAQIKKKKLHKRGANKGSSSGSDITPEVGAVMYFSEESDSNSFKQRVLGKPTKVHSVRISDSEPDLYSGSEHEVDHFRIRSIASMSGLSEVTLVPGNAPIVSPTPPPFACAAPYDDTFVPPACSDMNDDFTADIIGVDSWTDDSDWETRSAISL